MKKSKRAATQSLPRTLITSEAKLCGEANQNVLQTGPSQNIAKSDSEIFLSFNYPELKDLGKHFLTIISGVLAFSVVFSEKMIDFTKATPPQTTLLSGSWALLSLAAVCVGSGLYYNYIAGAEASGGIIRPRRLDYKQLARSTYRLYRLGGCAFVTGLLLMGIMALIKFR